MFYMNLYVHPFVDKLKWFYKNTRCFNKIYSSFILDLLTRDDGTDELSRNVGTELQEERRLLYLTAETWNVALLNALPVTQ